MASLASVVRITSRQSATWRTCTGCGRLAPLAPDATRCADCPPATVRTARRRAA